MRTGNGVSNGNDVSNGRMNGRFRRLVTVRSQTEIQGQPTRWRTCVPHYPLSLRTYNMYSWTRSQITGTTKQQLATVTWRHWVRENQQAYKGSTYGWNIREIPNDGNHTDWKEYWANGNMPKEYQRPTEQSIWTLDGGNESTMTCKLVLEPQAPE
jgi:hypothetical protein